MSSTHTKNKPAVSIKQVAEQAGVSMATVSRVLTGAQTVDQEMSERVREAAQRLDYQPNRIARSLRARTTRTIGVVIPDIQDQFFTSVVRGIEDELRKADYTLLLGNSDDDARREREYLATLRAEGVAGVVLFPVINKAATANYRQFLEASIPLVAIDRLPVNLTVDSVKVTNAAGVREAVAHLIRLGHRRIGLINGPAHLDVPSERQAGYEEALRAAGLQIEPEMIVHADFRESGGHAGTLALLDRRHPPSALFVANHLMTLGALQALHERKLHMPTDIALVTFDDMPWTRAYQPPLTVVAQPTYDMGTTAARLLLARLREPERATRQVVLETKLIVRASCGSGHANQTG